MLTGYFHTGVDDVLAMLLALSAQSEELEVVMISVTYGNVELQWHVGAPDLGEESRLTDLLTTLAAYEMWWHCSTF